jgi:hypothetical protein
MSIALDHQDQPRPAEQRVAAVGARVSKIRQFLFMAMAKKIVTIARGRAISVTPNL